MNEETEGKLDFSACAWLKQCASVHHAVPHMALLFLFFSPFFNVVLKFKYREVFSVLRNFFLPYLLISVNSLQTYRD